MAEMTDKQKRFAEEYMLDFNATQAAIRAGYSTRTAQRIGSEVLSKPLVRAYVDEMKAEESRRLGISPDRILNELAKIGFANIEDVADFDSAGVKSDVHRNETAAVASIRVKRTSGPYGDTVERELRMYDKHKALESLGKHLGLFEKDNRINVGGAIRIVDDIPMEDDGK